MKSLNISQLNRSNPPNITFWAQKHWQWLAIIFCGLAGLIGCWIRHPFDQPGSRRGWRPAMGTQTLIPEHQRTWAEANRRFKGYSNQSKTLIRQLYGNWCMLGPKEQARRQNIYRVFAKLPSARKSQLQSLAIFMECFSLENSYIPPQEVVQQWMLHHSDMPNLEPWELRSYIYQSFLIFNWCAVFPGLKENWKKLSAPNRLKLFQKVQKKLDRQMQHFWLPMFEQEIKAD